MLDQMLIQNSYQRIGVKRDWHQEVKEKYFKMNWYEQDDSVEMLYCYQGCRHGDEVLIYE